MSKPGAPRIAILGAGPVGLEAALYAARLGLPVTVYERGRVGEHVQQWGHVKLFSPFGMNCTPLGRSAVREGSPRHGFPADGDCTTGRGHLESYLLPLAQCEALRDAVQTQTEVLRVGRSGHLKGEGVGDPARGRQPFRLLLRKGKQEQVEEADVVLDCTGTYGRHCWLGDGGIPAPGETAAEPQLSYRLEDVLGDKKADYAGKNVLVVGAGYSAATTVCLLAELAGQHPDTWTVWLARGRSSQPIRRFGGDPLKERDRLAVRANTLATRADSNVEFHPASVVESIEPAGGGFRVRARCGGAPKSWEVDKVIANVGYTPDTDLYRELQVHECYASLGPMKLAASLLQQAGGDCLQQGGHGPDSLRNPEPNFYILGAKSYGRNSNFLLRVGFEQVRDVFQLITGRRDLDLYQ